MTTISDDERALPLKISWVKGRPVHVFHSPRVFHHISLTKGKKAEVGPEFFSDRNGAGSVFRFAKNGLLRWVRTLVHEHEVSGALRVHNLVPAGPRFRTGWTVPASGVTLTDLHEKGPNGEPSVTRLQRSSGTGAFLTMNSAAYSSGQKTAAIWMSSDKAVTITMQIQEQAGAPIASISFNPPPHIDIDLRTYISAVIKDASKLYKLQFLSDTISLDLRISDPSFEDTHGLDPEPGPYLNPNTVYDFGVAGVHYFLDYRHWVATEKSGFCKRSTPKGIDPLKILGYQIQPNWDNRDLFSDDIRNTHWIKFGLTTIDEKTTFADSVLFGPGSLMPLAENTTIGEHGISQTPLGPFEKNKIYTHWAYFLADTAAQVAIGFKNRDSVKCWASFDLKLLAVLQRNGSDVLSTHIKRIGDLIELSISDKSGLGAGVIEDYIQIADPTGAISYAGAAGRKVYFARTCFAKVDHAMVPLSPNAGAVGSGCGTATNGILLNKTIPPKDVTFFADFVFPEPGYWPARSGWKFLLYWTNGTRNSWNYVDVRGGIAMRGGTWSGAHVEGYTDPKTGSFIPGQYMLVADWYNGRSYMDNKNIYHEKFSVVMAPIMANPMKKLRVYISLRPSDVGTGSNISMRASDQDGYRDVNSDPAIEHLPPGMMMRLGYNEQAASATAQMWISNFTVLGYGMRMDEMAEHLKENPL